MPRWRAVDDHGVSGQLGRWGKGVSGLLGACAALVLAGCAGSKTSTSANNPTPSAYGACVYGLEALGDSGANARKESQDHSACVRVAHLCRWSISFSQFRTHTT